MTIEKKTDGSLHICIDPRDLNCAFLREHYQIKTVEEVATKLSSASVFSILDAGQAYYQVKVSEKSSKLLTFNTPFGRYRLLRMKFVNRKNVKSEVNYVGHVLSSKGLKLDDNKVIAIKQMESPKHKAAVLIAYIGKCIPNLSKRTSPLRESSMKTVDWHWDIVNQECVDDLRKAISEAPVL